MSKLQGELKENHNLKKYTSWHIGGVARYFYQPADLQDLSYFLSNFQEMFGAKKIIFLGAGSNVLIRDAGIDGVVICLRGVLNKLENIGNNFIQVESGATCLQLVNYCLSLNLVDCIFLAGIPGTLGGALAMNAGAHGDCLWNHVVAVNTIDKNGKINKRDAHEFKASYRHVEGLSADEWFVSATLKFTEGNVEAAKATMQELLQKRKVSQPLDEYNCGSVFKNPPNDFAARLIESCGLKGRQIGGAKISEKHANFIVNTGNATSVDVEMLMQEIIAVVEKRHKITLKPEVKILG